jgi:MOSC domain-containing protein YiiM
MAPATVLSVNVGRPAPLRTGDRLVSSAILKTPVTGPVAARGVNLEGDEQADRVNHGGPDQAVYLWENLTLAGVDVSGARIGERWRIGTAELRVAGPRVPCLKLASALGDPRMLKRFLHAGRPGAYLAIAREGVLQAGDSVEIVHRPEHDVSVALVIDALLIDHSRLGELAPARADMLPKLAGWYEEAVYATATAGAASAAS